MANITIQVPDAHVNRVQDAFATAYGWDQNDGETKAQLVRRKVKEFVVQVVQAQEATVAAEVARDAALVKAATDLA